MPTPKVPALRACIHPLAGAALCASLLVAPATHAEPVPTEPVPTEHTVVDDPSDQTRVPEEEVRAGEAHADRVVILPTAYTHPARTLYFTSYDIVLLQAGYAISDTTQFTITSSPPLNQGADRVFPLDLSIKSSVVHEGPVRVSAIASATGIMGLEQGNFLLGRFGGVTQLCFDRPCRSSASMAATVLLAGPATLVITGVGFIFRVSPGIALLAELEAATPLGKEAGAINGLSGFGGLRFAHVSWSLDLALGRALSTQSTAIPLLAFTYRFL